MSNILRIPKNPITPMLLLLSVISVYQDAPIKITFGYLLLSIIAMWVGVKINNCEGD